MIVRKVGIFISGLMFLAGLLAIPEAIDKLQKHSFPETGLWIGFLGFHLVYSIGFFFLALKLNSPDNWNRYKLCCWVGVFYVGFMFVGGGLFLGIKFWGRSEWWGMVILVVLVVCNFWAFSTPFTWSIRKLEAMEAGENGRNKIRFLI